MNHSFLWSDGAASGGFTPASLNPTFWIDPTDATTYDVSGATDCSALRSKSGTATWSVVGRFQVGERTMNLRTAFSHRDVANPTSAANATFAAGATVYTIATVFQLPGGGVSNNRITTLWNSTNPADWNNTNALIVMLSLGGTTGADSFNNSPSPGTITGVSFNTSGLRTIVIDEISATTMTRYYYLSNGTNAMLTGTMNFTGIASANRFTLGPGGTLPDFAYRAATYGDVIMVPRALTSQERTDLVAFLKAKWNIL